jgi:predicted DNA-binding transcriptional regulator AlpA
MDNLLKGLISEEKVAKDLCLKKITIQRWRLAGKMPAHKKIGRLFFYKEIDIKAWIDSKSIS